MNQTEAWEAVLLAAEAYERIMTLRDARPLQRALAKVKPRVTRMRARLDFIRARKAGKLNRPSWATP